MSASKSTCVQRKENRVCLLLLFLFPICAHAAAKSMKTLCNKQIRAICRQNMAIPACTPHPLFSLTLPRQGAAGHDVAHPQIQQSARLYRAGALSGRWKWKEGRGCSTEVGRRRDLNVDGVPLFEYKRIDGRRSEVN